MKSSLVDLKFLKNDSLMVKSTIAYLDLSKVLMIIAVGVNLIVIMIII